ncbi:WecB/TagA/CpsF family glycosyltransferase [Xanthobacter sp. DSM 24535]|uniref:WecB/TagA/CpsF family glycosyltransferase n=1 Tax=Roseixanthobacter psychrophilus TaxID=3119917 RepID=UPI00372BCE29
MQTHADPAAAARPFDEITYLGVPFSLLDVPAAAKLIAERPFGAPFAYVVTPNAQNLVRHGHLKDPRFIDIYAHAWLRLLDGKVPRALARKVFGLHIPLAPGSDLTADLLDHHIRPEDPVTIIGGEDEMLRRLKAKYGLQTVHHYNPPMGFINKPAEVAACVDFVLSHPARYIFLVVGSPRSEYVTQLIFQHGGAVGTALCVGSSLNFVTGLAKRAGPFYRKHGLEWLHRLIVSPETHIRRVFVESMPLLLMVAKAKLDPKAFGMDGGTQTRTVTRAETRK